ncbi:DoxX family protein [Nonomuraea zeae]|uniref:DoxX family protein n=1 Tax=Nonomuraea zeae TaxID=1642303 RepID=A0A5S4G8Z8_9ACTN|nr:DoxX family protein [Nonomuraea zeae]TMR28921.1 DoxX family protein [Nonomuraea zeae]
MNVLLWILQVVLAAVFAGLGTLKCIRAKEKLEPMLPWTADFSAGTVRFIGLAELLAALGLVLPAATGVAPVLTPLAGTGLALIMVLAAVTHLRRKEPAAIVVNAVLFAAAAAVAWGRYGPYAL